jgi:VIT1/CCC1 family predicted Fe2+/Mn2+ transporter
LLVVALAPMSALWWSVFATALVSLAVMGAVAARTGGADMRTGAVRVTFWGALAMVITTGVGALFGIAA